MEGYNPKYILTVFYSIILEDIVSKLHIQVIFVIFLHISATNHNQNEFSGKTLAKIEFSYTFVQETEFLDFRKGACHYDVTDTEDWRCWYFIWNLRLGETVS